MSRLLLTRSFLWATACLLLLPATALRAEDAPGLVTLKEYFEAETDRVRDASLAEVKSLEEWEKRRPELKRQLFEMLGLDPLPEKTPLNATIVGTIDEDEEIIVERIHFQSRPGLYVTGNFYRPREQAGPLPAILYVCGHARVVEDGKSYGNKTHYQHHANWYARNGYVCFVIDTLQLGEIEGIHHGVFPRALKPGTDPKQQEFDTRWWWYSRGYTPAGVEAWNGIRAIDYLQSREEVDPEKIGVTGRSGGGAYSWFVAALDDRVKAAVPVAGITDLEDHVVNDCIRGHCDCMFFVNTYRWDYPMLAAMIAPRPLLLSNTDKDPIFPLDGVVRTHDFTREIYRLYDAEKQLGLQITEGGHADTQELRIHSFVWMDRFLKGDRRHVEDAGEKPFAIEELRVFGDLPEDEKNTVIDETFVAAARSGDVPASADAWKKQRGTWLAKLNATTFGGWPSAQEAPAVKKIGSTEREEFVMDEYQVVTQKPFQLPLYVVRPKGEAKEGAVVFRALDEAGWADFATATGLAEGEDKPESSTIAPHLDEVKKDGKTLVLFAPRGIGPSAWDVDNKEQVHIQRRFMLLGQSLAGMQAWDVRAALRAASQVEGLAGRPLRVAAKGPDESTWALHALLDGPTKVAGLTLYNVPAGYEEAPEYLGISRILTLPRTVALVAERTPTTLVTNDAEAWDWAAKAGKALGWDDEQLVIERSAE